MRTTLCWILLVGLGATSAYPESDGKGARKYYLTLPQFEGDQVLTACARGYHMASLFEILDTSNLRYDTTLV